MSWWLEIVSAFLRKMRFRSPTTNDLNFKYLLKFEPEILDFKQRYVLSVFVAFNCCCLGP